MEDVHVFLPILQLKILSLRGQAKGRTKNEAPVCLTLKSDFFPWLHDALQG